MTQTTDPRRDSWRAPWAVAPGADGSAPHPPASQPDAGAPTAQQPFAPAPTAQQPVTADPGGTRPSDSAFWRTTDGAQTPGQTSGQTYGAGGALPPGPPTGRRGSGRPAWSGAAVVGVAAAVLSSLLTAGLVTALDDDPASPVTSTSSASAPAGTSDPIVTGSSASPDWKAVASAVEPSVVSVRVAGQAGSGEGSGVILDTTGNVLTNNHVIASAAQGGRISIVLSDGRTYAATIAGRDPATDLAVVRLTDPPSDLTAATLGNSAAVEVGDPVMAVGNPLGLSDTATTGIVSALNRPVTTSAQQQEQGPLGGQGGSAQAEQVVTNAIQTDAAVNPGNSGGALVDAGGRVIGITSSIATLGSSMGGPSGSIGLGFAIPINEAKTVADQLKQGETVEHAYLGVTLADGTATADGTQRQAAVVGTVSDGTPAAQAGLRAEDAIVAVDGRAIDSADSLVAQIRALRPDTRVTLTVVRDGASLQVPVTLAVRPAQ